MQYVCEVSHFVQTRLDLLKKRDNLKKDICSDNLKLNTGEQAMTFQAKQKVTIVIGLPGSGKTTYLVSNFQKLPGTLVCDDFHAQADSNSEDLERSRHFEEMKKALATGRSVVIADIAYCSTRRLDKVESQIKELAGQLGIDFGIKRLYFENDPTSCRRNLVKRRRGESQKLELSLLGGLSRIYVIPPGAEVLPVVVGG